MEFEGILGKATDEDGAEITMTNHNTKIQDLLANTKWDNTDKFGEGNFTLRLTVVENPQNNAGKKDVKVELLDKSKFNGEKEHLIFELR